MKIKNIDLNYQSRDLEWGSLDRLFAQTEENIRRMCMINKYFDPQRIDRSPRDRDHTLLGQRLWRTCQGHTASIWFGQLHLEMCQADTKCKMQHWDWGHRSQVRRESTLWATCNNYPLDSWLLEATNCF